MKSVLRSATVLLFVVAACEPAQPAVTPAAAAPVATAAPAPVVEAAPAATPVTDAPAPSAIVATPITANIESKSGSKATGTVTLTEAKPGVHVVVTVAGATVGAHGLHFHEIGDCSAADGSSAKAHYNPTKHEHGLPSATARHLGDLGNIMVASDGKGKLEIDLPDASLDPNAPNTLRGKAVILHEKVDDGSQPVGNSGARIGCAVIP